MSHLHVQARTRNGATQRFKRRVTWLPLLPEALGHPPSRELLAWLLGLPHDPNGWSEREAALVVLWAFGDCRSHEAGALQARIDKAGNWANSLPQEMAALVARALDSIECYGYVTLEALPDSEFHELCTWLEANPIL